VAIIRLYLRNYVNFLKDGGLEFAKGEKTALP
jgi:hypothetical protein